MNAKEFDGQDSVAPFVKWLREALPKLRVRLRIAKSKQVPKQRCGEAVGIENVTKQYIWKSGSIVPTASCPKGFSTLDWNSTSRELAKVASDLREAVKNRDHDGVHSCCSAIMEWGGGARSRGKGADRFLTQKRAEGNISQYIETVGAEMKLETATLEKFTNGKCSIEKLNSMLTKVHALYADDGLPIYDSRVAIAMAALVELYRRKTGRFEKPPEALLFPAIDREYDVDPRVIEYQIPGSHAVGTFGARTPVDTLGWASAMIVSVRSGPSRFAFGD